MRKFGYLGLIILLGIGNKFIFNYLILNSITIFGYLLIWSLIFLGISQYQIDRTKLELKAFIPGYVICIGAHILWHSIFIVENKVQINLIDFIQNLVFYVLVAFIMCTLLLIGVYLYSYLRSKSSKLATVFTTTLICLIGIKFGMIINDNNISEIEANYRSSRNECFMYIDESDEEEVKSCEQTAIVYIVDQYYPEFYQEAWKQVDSENDGRYDEDNDHLPYFVDPDETNPDIDGDGVIDGWDPEPEDPKYDGIVDSEDDPDAMY